MPCATFSAWSAHCVKGLSNNAWSNVTASQIAYLSPAGASGTIPSSPIFDPPDLPLPFPLPLPLPPSSHFFSSSSFVLHIGLQAKVVSNMPGESGGGWSNTSLSAVPYQKAQSDGCAGFTSQQVYILIYIYI